MAIPKKLIRVDTEQIDSPLAVLAELEQLNRRLAASDLSELVMFNQAYMIVIQTIIEAGKNDYFANPEFLGTFSVCFVSYYFRTINDLSAASPKTVPAWQTLNQAPKRKQRPAFIALLLGANAHMNHDLPLAMTDAIDRSISSELLKDLAKVDKLLMTSAHRILDSFSEPTRHMDFIKRYGRWLYFRPVMYMIFVWRIIAWHNYKQLAAGRKDATSLIKRSNTIADRLQWVGNRLG